MGKAIGIGTSTNCRLGVIMSTDLYNLVVKAFVEAMEADKRYAQQLVAVYGRKAQDARYDSVLNRATPELSMLHDDAVTKADVYLNLNAELRNVSKLN